MEKIVLEDKIQERYENERKDLERRIQIKDQEK